MRRMIRQWLLRLVGALLRQIPTRKLPASPQRVLVVKPDHAGDVLLLTPALQLLRTQLPHAHITLLVGPWATPLLCGNPLINSVQTCAFPGFTRQPKPSLLQPYWLLLQTTALVRLGRYDAALIARDDHWWGALILAFAGIPQRIGFAVPTVAPFLTTALPHDPHAHVSVQNLALVTALTEQATVAVPATSLVIPSQAQAWADEKVEQYKEALFVAIHPGAGGQAKLWLAQRWIAVGQALEGRGFQVLLTGGPAEVALVQSIAADLQQPLVITDATDLQHLGALFTHCTLVLGVDSGPLHVAVAVGVPTVALFGPGDVGRFGPWGDPRKQRVAHSGLWCSPCGVLDQCPRGTAPSECMTLIGVRDVLGVIDEMLPAYPAVSSSTNT